MATNKRPRKKYRPRPVELTASTRVLGLHTSEPTPADSIRDMLSATHLSLDAIEKGKGVSQDVAHLAFCSNVTLLLCEQGFGRDLIPDVKTAQEHILELHGRELAGKPLVLTVPGMLAVRHLLAIHTAQTDTSELTLGRLRTAIMEVHNRMMEGHVFEPAPA